MQDKLIIPPVLADTIADAVSSEWEVAVKERGREQPKFAQWRFMMNFRKMRKGGVEFSTIRETRLSKSCKGMDFTT